MALFTEYDVVGLKEDISDVISNISPTKTPFQSMIGSEKVTQKLFQWQEDTLRATASNAQVEGFTAQDVVVTPTVMRNNVTQILAETVKVAGSMDAADTYGRAKETAYQLAKSMAQVKRDLEFAMVGSAQSKVTGSNIAARQMSGYQDQILNDSTGTPSVTNLVVYTGGAATAPKESDILTVLQFAYINGGDPTVIMVTPTNSLVVADFAKSAGRYRTLESTSSSRDQRAIVNVVDLYVSPFGEQRVVLNRFQKSGNTMLFAPDMWRKIVFRNWFRETLAKTGDNQSNMIVGEFSLKHRNKQASGIVAQVAGPTGY